MLLVLLWPWILLLAYTVTCTYGWILQLHTCLPSALTPTPASTALCPHREPLQSHQCTLAAKAPKATLGPGLGPNSCHKLVLPHVLMPSPCSYAPACSQPQLLSLYSTIVCLPIARPCSCTVHTNNQGQQSCSWAWILP